jgi:hypothetical protein|uniref:Uncharacterized protein n=1 Tax=Fagus sylvatica TaxID=28930 RepID=A0A2N9HNI1_FAGSY
MTTTRTTTSDDRMAALEVSTHGLQRQLVDQQELSGVRNAMAALTDTIAQIRRDNDNYNSNEANNEGGSANQTCGGQNTTGRNTSRALGENHGGVQPRFAQLDFSRFNGEDLTGWIYIA